MNKRSHGIIFLFKIHAWPHCVSLLYGFMWLTSCRCRRLSCISSVVSAADSDFSSSIQAHTVNVNGCEAKLLSAPWSDTRPADRRVKNDCSNNSFNDNLTRSQSNVARGWCFIQHINSHLLNYLLKVHESIFLFYILEHTHSEYFLFFFEIIVCVL